MESQLADNDQLEGSTGGHALGNLYQQYAGARAGIGDSAVDATNSLRAKVDNAKTSLYGLAQQAVDPLKMAQQAQASAGAIVSPSSYPSIGDAFAGALGPLQSAASTYNSSMKGQGQPQGGGGAGISGWFAPV